MSGSRRKKMIRPSRVHQLGRLRRLDLLGRYLYLLGENKGVSVESSGDWSRDRLIAAIVRLEEARARVPLPGSEKHGETL